MSKQPSNNTMHEEEMSTTRRKFLKQLAFGSLATICIAEVANAVVRDVVYPRKYGYHRLDQGKYHFSGYTSQNFRRHAPHVIDHKTLAFEHIHTGDKLKLTYFERGKYVKEALHEINFLLRDFRTNDVYPIDIALLDQLYTLKQVLGVNKPFHIISGYRSPLTNAQLRKSSRAVSEHSFHMKGRAIDIRLEGISSKTVRNAALSMAQGGVGYYPRDNFIHLDTGRFRTW